MTSSELIASSGARPSGTLSAGGLRRVSTLAMIRLSVSIGPSPSGYLYSDPLLIDRQSTNSREIFPSRQAVNKLITLPGIGNRKDFGTFAANAIIALDFAFEKAQCFPLNTYPTPDSPPTPNITDAALARFRQHYSCRAISREDIFHYVYAILHHPAYRERYADNLKKELPRIPFAPDFQAFADIGRELMDLHINYEQATPFPLQFLETKGLPLSYAVKDKLRLSKDRRQIQVNPSLTLAGIPEEVFGYRLGNRSALEWIIDQYQVYTDPKSGIISDPNRPDDPEYITRLICQVVTVSLESLRLIRCLPPEFR